MAEPPTRPTPASMPPRQRPEPPAFHHPPEPRVGWDPPQRVFLVTFRHGFVLDGEQTRVISRSSFTVREGIFVFGDGTTDQVKTNIIAYPADTIIKVEEITAAQAIVEEGGLGDEATKPSSDFADPMTDMRAEHPPEAVPDGEQGEPALGETGTCLACVGPIEYREIEMDPDEPDKRTWVHVGGKKSHSALPAPPGMS